MTKVVVREGETIDSALRRFNQKVFEAGIMDELKRREYYEPPSEIKKRRRKEVERKIARENR